HRTDVDDAPALTAEILDRFLGGKNEAEEIQIELLVEVLWRYLFHGRKLVNARVVDENIDPPECLFRFGQKPLDVRRLRHVRLHGNGPAPLALDLPDDAVRPRFAGGVVHHHGRTLVSEVPGDGCPDALRSPGDDRDFTLEFVRHFSDSLRLPLA